MVFKPRENDMYDWWPSNTISITEIIDIGEP